MSKKLYSTLKWKRYMKARQKYQLAQMRARRVHLRLRRSRNLPLERLHPGQLPFVPLKVPQRFSMIDNPEETIAFFRSFRDITRRNNLQLNMQSVNYLTVDAITALVAEIVALGQSRYMRGTYPEDESCRSFLLESGFHDYVKSTQPITKVSRGKIAKRKSKMVESVTAKDLIRFGSQAAFGTAGHCYAAYATLVECMSNTHNHATGKTATQGSEAWYSTVYGDKAANRVCFTFLDTGVGIFRSVKYGMIRRVYKLFRWQDDRQILKDLLHGQVESRTGLPFRGKGLPSIYRNLTAGRIKSLVIVANDVYANVAINDYRVLDTPFPGTLLYWES
jgi:hypothetical protein